MEQSHTMEAITVSVFAIVVIDGIAFELTIFFLELMQTMLKIKNAKGAVINLVALA